MDISLVSSLELLWIKLLWTLIKKSLSRHMFPFIFSKNPELGFGSYCQSMVNSKEIAKLTPKLIVPFYIPPPTWEFQFLHTHVNTWNFQPLHFNHSTECTVLSHCGLCWISLMINAIEHIFWVCLAFLYFQMFRFFTYFLSCYLYCYYVVVRAFSTLICPFWDNMYCKYFFLAWLVFHLFLKKCLLKGKFVIL